MKKYLLLIIGCGWLSSCGDWFDTHPYDVDFDGETDINAKQMAVIESRCADKDTLRVAFISDTHLWIADTRDEVESLNRRGNIDFVVHCGDLTYTGSNKEYKWSRDVLSELSCPYVALIGNHDFLGTGDEAYEAMYGKKDFSFIAARVKFICINTNVLEEGSEGFGDTEVLPTTLFRDFDRTIVVMHAPPYSDQFDNDEACKAFRRYLDELPGLLCCVHGHNHNDVVSDIYGDGLLFYGIDCAEHRNYRVFTITKDGYDVEQVCY